MAQNYDCASNSSSSTRSNNKVKSVGAILNFLVKSNGWALWTDLFEAFQISNDFCLLQNLLVNLKLHDNSFTGEHNHWISPVYYKTKGISLSRPEEVFLAILITNLLYYLTNSFASFNIFTKVLNIYIKLINF